MLGENHPNWHGGSSFEPYCQKFNPEFRERVRAFFDYRCVICGKSQEENGRKLMVHHVDYLKKACCDTSHHAKTNFNRPYWQATLRRIIIDKYGGQCYLPKRVRKPRGV